MQHALTLIRLAATHPSVRSTARSFLEALRSHGPKVLSLFVFVTVFSVRAFAQQDIEQELESAGDWLVQTLVPLLAIIAIIGSGIALWVGGREALGKFAMVVAGTIICVCAASIVDLVVNGF